MNLFKAEWMDSSCQIEDQCTCTLPTRLNDDDQEEEDGGCSTSRCRRKFKKSCTGISCCEEFLVINVADLVRVNKKHQKNVRAGSWSSRALRLRVRVRVICF